MTAQDLLRQVLRGRTAKLGKPEHFCGTEPGLLPGAAMGNHRRGRGDQHAIT
jgi:hypothetical protein